MAEVDTAKIPSLAEHYLLEKEQKQEVAPKPVEEPEVTPIIATPVEETDEPVEETVEKTEETPSVVDNEAPPVSAEAEVETSAGDIVENQESSPTDEAVDDPISTPEESNDSVESEDADNQESEEAPEIKLETAPADFRFPTTNQTRHCFTRYIEYHRCIAAKGNEAPECQKFAKYYRAICPGEWVERWNEQRENGTFPGPL